jgi:hypothetical protein
MARIRIASIVVFLLAACGLVALQWYPWFSDPPQASDLPGIAPPTDPLALPEKVVPTDDGRRVEAVSDGPADPHRQVVLVDSLGQRIVGATVRQTVDQKWVATTTDGLGATPLLTRCEELLVSADGFATSEFYGADLEGTGDVTAVLPPAAELVIVVTDSSGQRVAGQTVLVSVEEDLHPHNVKLAKRAVSTTNVAGEARMADLGNARYWVSVVAFRGFGGTDIYDVRPVLGKSTLIAAEVAARDIRRVLDIEVAGLEGSTWRDGACVDYAIEDEVGNSLLRIWRPFGLATVLGDYGKSVKVRVVAMQGLERVEGGYRSAWAEGMFGQEWPLQLQAR